MDGLRRHILPGLTSTPRAGHFIFKATEEIAISAKTRLLHYFQKIQKTEETYVAWYPIRLPSSEITLNSEKKKEWKTKTQQKTFRKKDKRRRLRGRMQMVERHEGNRPKRRRIIMLQ
jgi:hypothetical protein